MTSQTTKPCPHCQSERVFQSDKQVDTTTLGGELVPKLGANVFSGAKVRAVVCGDCGLLRHFVATDALGKLEASKHWKLA